MASTLNILPPTTRSGRTFFVALVVLGVGALGQFVVLGIFLLRGGIAARPSTEIHFVESLAATDTAPLAAPVRLQPALPTPAPAAAPAVPADSATADAPLMTRPTPAPAARYQAGTGTLLEQSRQLRARGDMNSALARLREAQVAEPDNPQVIAEMALTYEAMQILDRAFEQWQRLYNFGEGIGALYYLADTKLHAAPAAALAAPGGAAAAGAQDGAPALNPAAVLKLADVHKADLTDDSVERKISVKIVVKNRPGTVIDPMKVRILTYFYDLIDGEHTVLTDAQTDFAWLTGPPVNWANDKSEVLETIYLRPKPAPTSVPAPAADATARGGKAHPRRKGEPAEATPAPVAATPAPVRVYGGYTVRVYYDRQLQDAQADPPMLLQRYPPPANLPTE